MKKLFLFIATALLLLSQGTAQVQIFQENFGSTTWQGNPADYPGYTSDGVFGGDYHLFQTAASSGYDQASGGAAVLMGAWGDPANEVFVLQTNTEDYLNVQLSFGIKHNSGGWGTCQLTNNFTKIEYSTDSASWTTIDKAALINDSKWPCADENSWGFVELAEVLPSAPSLNIRFTHTQPTIHPYYLDDITLTAFLPDDEPPSAPGALQADLVEYTGCVLAWNSSTDNNGISHYEILKNGNPMMSVSDTMVRIEYQMPGSTAGFSVVAYDVAGNPSPASSTVPVSFQSRPPDYQYSWEKEHARILPSGDIEWQPEPFTFEPGSSVRYIDYENGDDASDGMTRATAWKHHPWDNNATGNAAAASGIHTYVFKRGVVYRGHLTAKESGNPLEPIRLTSDPTWGTGEAYFFGSRRITGTWTRADASGAPNIPEADKVWYTDLYLPGRTKFICELDGDQFKQVRVARSPNYRYTDGDPLETWWTWTTKYTENEDLWLRDNVNLTADDPAYYEGATVFSQEDAIVMCTVWKQDVLEWDPDGMKIRVNNTNFGGVGSHYFIENTPFLLDTTNEFYYDTEADRLFIRLDEDKDPNTAIIEAATETELIKIDGKHDIEISGITFGMTTAHGVRFGEEDARSTIRMTGICNNIEIRNNQFYYVNGGISMNNTGSSSLNSHGITISDNNFQHVGDLAIVMSTSTVYMDDVNILRNNIYHNGFRHQGRWYSSIPAIYGQLNYGEVAGNVVERSFGNGIDMFWGKGGGSNHHVPFRRGLVHHNKASQTLIGVNDYGGIESWQGGPAYIYNNYSHNASGYKHYNNSSIGYAYYFDGAFKHIVFNNIASGVSHNRNAASIMQVLGFYNMYVHNTGYMTEVFLNAWKGTLGLNGHNTYLSNVAQETNAFFRHQLDPSYIPYESYGNNISSVIPFNAGLLNRDNNLSLDEFRSTLEEYEAQLTQTGYNTEEEVLTNPGTFDFRPVSNSAAAGRGVRFFTAFPLARVVGEWNFYEHPADSSIVMGDNFYMTADFNDRTTYKDVAKNHLTVHNVADSSFVKGALEDWTRGALTFDGAVYGEISHTETSAVRSNNVDMTDNDFILEAFFRTEKGHTNGVLVAKSDGTSGYQLAINESGHAEISLLASGAAVSRVSTVAVNDSAWHHILVEVERHSGINLFVDGSLSNGTLTGSMPDPGTSLSNSTDLLVGKDADDYYFRGMIDFLRISRGSLFDAKTTIDELDSWQTDGPFLYDMRGTTPDGQRDAGALELARSCEMSLSDARIGADENGGLFKIVVTAPEGFIIRENDGAFFTTTINEDTIEVEVEANAGLEIRTGTFTVFGCNESHLVTVTQAGAPCSFTCDVTQLDITGEAQTLEVAVSSNGSLAVSSDMAFAVPSLNDDQDTVRIEVAENLSGAGRTADITLEHCNGVHTITVVQQSLTGIFDAMNTGGLRIYPNPVPENQVLVILPGEMNRYTYTISDLTGKKVQNGQLFDREETIELQVEPGLYQIRVTGNGTIYKGRIVVL